MDEILSTFLAHSEIRQNIKKIKKQKKFFDLKSSKKNIRKSRF